MKRIQRDHDQRLSIDTYSQSVQFLKDNSREELNDRDHNSSVGEDYKTNKTTADYDEQDMLLQYIKPVLKKNLTHYSQGVIMTFKSVEITISEQIDEKTKTVALLYVPL